MKALTDRCIIVHLDGGLVTSIQMFRKRILSVLNDALGMIHMASFYTAPCVNIDLDFYIANINL